LAHIAEQKTDYYSWSLSCEKARSILGYELQVNLMHWLRQGLFANDCVEKIFLTVQNNFGKNVSVVCAKLYFLAV